MLIHFYNFYRDNILYMLHISGAKRCGVDGKGCLKGCVMEGSYDGTPDDTMKHVMTIDREGMYYRGVSWSGW